MARVVSIQSKAVVSLSIITRFADGTDSTRTFKVGDTVENLRYIENGEVKTVSGHVDDITFNVRSSTINSGMNAKNTFGRDVRAINVVIDGSDVYDSKLYTIPVKEIVEDEGVENVIKVDNVTSIVVDITIEYSDGTIEETSLEPGDIVDATIMNSVRGKPDYEGRYSLVAFTYKNVNNQPSITGMGLKNVDTGKMVVTSIGRIIKIHEIPTAKVTDFADIAPFLAEKFATEDEVAITLAGDVTVPERTDGKIVTTMINAGKKLTVDLAGHKFATKAYAFYVNGGEIAISDSTGNGKIEAGMPGVAYPAVQVTGGVCTMTGGTIDCTNVEVPEGSYNWMYGVVCSKDGIFNMTGGKIHIAEASCVSITNGTASGIGAQFIIGGKSELVSDEGPAVYNADQKTVVIKDNAVVKGGILARLGTVVVEGNGTVEDYRVSGEISDLGEFLPQSGSISFYGYGPIAIMSGCYTSQTGDNSIGVQLKDNATLKSSLGNGVVIVPLDTKMDQTVEVEIDNSVNINVAKDDVKVYTHEELMELAEAAGTASKINITNQSTVTVNGEQVFPLLTEETPEEG